MNILFLTLLDFNSFAEKSIYTDLLREFIADGHNVFAISPVERRKKTGTYLIEEGASRILKVKIGNTQKTNIIEKGISTVSIEPLFIRAIKKYFRDVKFDLVLYSTPPITFVGAIDYVKKRDDAKAYLLLKDIFPQNAVDLGMMSTTGPKKLLYRYFRRKEKKLYSISDRIGCMSQANVDYVIAHNPEVDPQDIEVCPNSIEVTDKSVDAEARKAIRLKYDIPLDKKVFIYGGNLGKPQGIPFLIECIDRCKNLDNIFFLIVGDGTEYRYLEEYVASAGNKNFRLMKRLPKEDYDAMVGACDAGMIFLDHRFTIPNFPSRLLSYMQSRLPVLAVTDANTDIGKIITEGNFGWWCESNDSDHVAETVKAIENADLSLLGDNAYKYLEDHYSSKKGYEIIIEHC